MKKYIYLILLALSFGLMSCENDSIASGKGTVVIRNNFPSKSHVTMNDDSDGGHKGILYVSTDISGYGEYEIQVPAGRTHYLTCINGATIRTQSAIVYKDSRVVVTFSK